ncbi:hypothetical protein ACTFIZ_009836 [Dictyostelium cf. discoideum]
MTIFNSISSISNSTLTSSTSIACKYIGSSANDNSTACFDNDFGGWGGLGGFNSGCGGCGSNVNVINLDIDIGRRRHRAIIQIAWIRRNSLKFDKHEPITFNMVNYILISAR